MTKSDTRSDRPPTPPANTDTLTAFEEALALLSGHDRGQTPVDTNLPALPLPSLLERCEDMLARQDRPADRRRLLLCFPGLAPVSPDWWQNRVAGIGCVRASVSSPDLGPPAPEVAEATGRRAMAAMLEGLSAEFAQEGRDLLVTAETGDLLPGGPWAHSLLLVCHPATAYRAVLRRGHPAAPTLDRFCDDLLADLSARPDRPWRRIEDLGDSRAAVFSALCRLLEIRQPPGLDDTSTPDPAPAPAAPTAGTGGYQRLCAGLGYDPADIPPLPADPPAAASRRPAPRDDPDRQPALVSEFLQRLDRVCALAPDGGRDQALVLQSGTDVTALLDTCLSEGEENLLGRLDAALETLLPADSALLLFACAAHFKARGQRLQALSFVAEGLTQAAAAQGRWLQVLGAALYADLGAADQALTALLSDVLTSDVLTVPGQNRLTARLEGLVKQQQEPEHGHALLIEQLTRTPPPQDGRKRLMVEIGTTREQVAGQGSTLKLAQLCTDLGLNFVTVDMDPRNTRQAQMMFRRNGFAFCAITAKGEDYLAGFEGEIDYVFLDAYDFDHGMHSNLRQSRYEKFLGSRIEETQCHQMHLDCATALIDKLAPDGLICFDDTWQDESGAWTAKGTTAMPFLLENGFEIIAARNKAALLRRASRRD